MNKQSIKITFLGDGATGKSSFFTRFKEYENSSYRFDKKYKSTEDFNFKRMTLNTNLGQLKIDMWDTAGQEKTIGGLNRDAYIKGSDAVIILYDVTNRKTINNIKQWLDDTKETCGHIPVAVCGNKIDKFSNAEIRKCKLYREAQLKTMYYGSLSSQLFGFYNNDNIKGFLISVKENTEYSNSDFKDNGILNPFEYLLSKHYKKDVKLHFDSINNAFEDEF